MMELRGECNAGLPRVYLPRTRYNIAQTEQAKLGLLK
jgi:hypothetical protein